MLDVSSDHLNIILDILKRFVPLCEVRAFGSRCKWTAKDYSDLDLAIVGNEKIDLKILADIKNAFEESDLPYRVDVLDWNAISENFRKIINEKYEVIQKAENDFEIESGLPDGWRLIALFEAVDLNPKRSLSKNINAKYVPMEALNPFERKIRFYENKEFKGGSKFTNSDTLMARITPCLENGKTAYVDILEDNEIAFGSTEFIVLSSKPNITNDKFVYYLSISPKIREKAIQSMNGTSGRQRVQTEILANTNIHLPPLKEQKSIASILSSLDEKIELNRKMNETLEKIAQAIFKHWFIDFEFPDKNGKPYKSSGGKMVETELGKIPEGWKIKKIKELGNVVCGKTPSKSNKRLFDGKIPFIKIPDMHNNCYIIKTEDSLSEEGKNSQKNKTLPPNSVCISCIATVGLVSITSKESQTNQQINSIIPLPNIGPYYLFFFIKEIKKLLHDMASGGSATLNLNTNNFSNIEILVPDEIILNKFNTYIKEIFEKILLNTIESNNLFQIRDLLLPKLMSGKIRVKS